MSNSSFDITPRQGTYLVGLANMLASMCSTQIVRYIGRRKLLIFGHLGIAVVHSLVGYFNTIGSDIGVLSMLLTFLFVYQNTSGIVCWIYCAETTIDAALGICLFTLWGTVFILSLVSPILMNEDSLGPTNVFYMFGGISILGMIYCYVFIKETFGLTDHEKKTLYLSNDHK